MPPPSVTGNRQMPARQASTLVELTVLCAAAVDSTGFRRRLKLCVG